MSELFRKEWRDARWIIIGLVVLAPIASLALKFLLLGGNRFDENASAGGFIPAMLLLYVLAVGADIVAADAGSGRIGFLAALPVRPRTLWGVKAGFLFGGAAIYLVGLLVMETVFLTGCGLNGLRVFTVSLPKYAFLYAIVAVVAAATLMYSTLIDRGFAAVIAALFTIGGIAGAALHFHPAPKQIPHDSVAAAAALLTVAFLSGSLLAFTKGRIHLGGRGRRIAFAVGAFLLVFGLPATLTVAGAARRLHVGLTDQDVEARLLLVDDEGKWAVGWLHRGSSRDPLLGVLRKFRIVGVSLEDGRIRGLGTGDNNSAPGRRWFTEAGRYVCVDEVWIERFQRSAPRRREYDLEAGRQVSLSQPQPDDVLWPGFRYANGTVARRLGRDAWELLLPGREPIRLAHRERPYHCENSWGVLIHPRTMKAKEWILRLDTGERLDVPEGLSWKCVVLLPNTPDGSAFAYAKSGALIRVPMDGAAATTVFDEWRSISDRMSTAGDHLLVRAEGMLHLLRADGGRVLRLDGPLLPTGQVDSRWEKGGSRLVVRGRERLWIGDAADPNPKLTPLPIRADAGNPKWFSGDRLLLEDGRLTLWTLDGQSRQILPVKEVP